MTRATLSDALTPCLTDGTAVAGLTLHRSPGSSFWAPVLRPAALSLLGVLIMVLATENSRS